MGGSTCKWSHAWKIFKIKSLSHTFRLEAFSVLFNKVNIFVEQCLPNHLATNCICISTQVATLTVFNKPYFIVFLRYVIGRFLLPWLQLVLDRCSFVLWSFNQAYLNVAFVNPHWDFSLGNCFTGSLWLLCLDLQSIIQINQSNLGKKHPYLYQLIQDLSMNWHFLRFQYVILCLGCGPTLSTCLITLTRKNWSRM